MEKKRAVRRNDDVLCVIPLYTAGTSAAWPAEAGCLFYFEKDLMSPKLPPMGRFLKKVWLHTPV